MSDAESSHTAETGPDAGTTDGAMPLWQRALYMFGFGILAYFTFLVLIFLAIVQLIVMAIDKAPNKDLKKFSRNTVQYLFELMAYLAFSSDERPFPFGPFPSVPE